MNDDIDRLKHALLQRQNEVFRNACEQLDGIAELMRAYQYYMGRSGRAVLGDRYQQPMAPPPPARQRARAPDGTEFDDWGVPRRN